ncbi:MAG: type II toxin-antitoxin system RatA family toxin [Halapricum sp.]
MDTIEVSTVVFCPREEVYEFLVDFPRYANLSKHLREVRQDGDGSPGTRYALRFAWWKLSYTAHSRVTSVEPPDRIDWELTQDLDAHGSWLLEAEPDADEQPSTRVRLVVEFDPHSAKSGALDLPRFVSLGWVIEKVIPLVQDEAERVVRRLVADLEGEPRPVELDIHTVPDSI